MDNFFIDINYILSELKKTRRVFNSEADFQFSLAWKIKEIYGQRVDIRLEYSIMLCDDKVCYVDIVIFLDKQHFIPIELKYKTKSTLNPLLDDNDSFYLKTQGATDLGKFDYLLDIERMESYKEIYGFAEGYCIFLTNDESYTKTTSKNTRNKEFSIGQNEVKTGTMIWREDSSIYRNKQRKGFIHLDGTYQVNWQEFCDLNQDANSIFYILVNRVRGEKNNENG